MKRGEVWTVAGGPEFAGKPRPAVIVQEDGFDATVSVTVCLLTTTLRGEIVRPELLASASNGLRETSRIMVDKITTVPVVKLGLRLGVLEDHELSVLDQALLVFLGLARRTTS